MIKYPFQIFQFCLLFIGVGLIIYNLISLDLVDLFSRKNTGNYLGVLANCLLAFAMWISLHHSFKKNENG